MAAMNNKEATELSFNSDFRRYVISGIVEIASEVLDEDPSTLEPAVSAKRVALAQRVTRDYSIDIKAFLINLAVQENLNKDITYDPDGNIIWAGANFSTAVNTHIVIVWDYIAGVCYADENP